MREGNIGKGRGIGKLRFFYNLILEVASPYFCHILFMRSVTRSCPHSREGAIETHEYQEAGIIGRYLIGCLLHFFFSNFSNLPFHPHSHLIIFISVVWKTKGHRGLPPQYLPTFVLCQYFLISSCSLDVLSVHT